MNPRWIKPTARGLEKIRAQAAHVVAELVADEGRAPARDVLVGVPFPGFTRVRKALRAAARTAGIGIRITSTSAYTFRVERT